MRERKKDPRNGREGGEPKRKQTHLPNPITQNKIHRHAPILEQPLLIWYTPQDLGHELFAVDVEREVGYELEGGVDCVRDVVSMMSKVSLAFGV